MDQETIVKVVRNAPDLWIERLVIYSDLREKAIIRDIPFARGLNLIWGASESIAGGDASGDTFLIGHSVGKTSLCRLIRYALDEETFGQEDAVDQVRMHFERGGVGLTLHLKGIRWSVIRKFQSGSVGSNAAIDVTIEELLDQTVAGEGYTLYREAIRASLTQGIPGFDEKDGFKWRELLSWLTRDQEARYESLWKWRDPRSNSQTKALLKTPALRLMASVLGLFSEDANKLVKLRDDLETKRKETLESIEAHNRRREIDTASFDSDIDRLLGKYGHLEEVRGGLFSIDNAILRCKQKNNDDIDDLIRQRDDTVWQLNGYRVSERQIDEQITTISRQLMKAQDVIEPPERNHKLVKLLEVQSKDCTYGNIPFADCQYMAKYVDQLRNPYANYLRTLQDDAAADASDTQRLREREWLADQLNLSADLNYIRTNIERLIGNAKELDRRITELSRDTDDLVRWAAARSRVARESPLINSISDFDRNIKTYSEKLTRDQREQNAVNVELQSLFDRLVRYLLSPRYSGKINLQKDEQLEFRLEGMKGEAILTLTSVIADICAMLLSVEGYGYQPGFLVHDSPREADLSGSAYAAFLTKIHSLALELGNENAPFQYIITTTTPPPEQLNDCIRLRLCGYPVEEMLFKKNIELGPDLTMDL